MYILFAIIFSSSGAVSTSAPEFTSYNSCLVAKQAIEQSYNIGNYRILTCVAK